MIKFLTAIFLIIFSFQAHSKERITTPKIAVSIKPIHSIVANITDRISEPYLIVSDNSSPHDYALKPSAVKNINDADIIIFVSNNLEVFIEKSLKSIENDKVIMQLLKIDELNKLKNRANDLKHDDKSHESHHQHGNNIDPHIWLSPKNTTIIAGVILDILVEYDAKNADKYKENFFKFLKKNISLSKHYKEELESYKKKPFIVFHDAYQYFEEYYDLNNVGSITVPSSSGLGAKRIKEIEDIIKTSNVSCIFTEPQFSSTVINNIFSNKNITIKTIDPIGYKIEAGKDAYFVILDNIVNNFKSCLEGS